MDLNLRMLADASNAQGAFKDLGSAVTAAGAILLDFSKTSVKAFAEAERAQTQLRHAAGPLTDAFEAQAEAISKQLAVEDEQVKKMQTLMLSYGVLPNQIDAAVRAIYDYSAVTGKDAVQATETLIRGIESGSGSLGKMGVHFQSTGDQAKDMARAIEALNEKFGGAAASDADTLDGRMRAASVAAGELEEAWGGFLATLEAKFGILEKTANVLRNMSDSRAWTQGTRNVTWEDPSATTLPQDSPWHTAHLGTSYGKGVDVSFGDLTLEKTKSRPGAAVDRIHSAMTDDARLSSQAERNKRWIKEEEDFELRQQEIYDSQMERQRKNIEESNDLMMKAFEKQEDQHTKDLEKLGELQFEMMKMQTEKQKAELERRTNQWMRIGAMIGQALVNGILDVIEGQKKGQDTSKIGIGITRALFNAVFSMFGMGWMSQAAFGAGDAAAEGGGLAGLGSFVGGTAGNVRMDPGFTAPTQHTGGWIERFHGGGPVLGRDERMAILQTGERVLSRREVASMGGMGGVDSAARGGSGRSLVIQAFDSSSLLDFFGDRGGRGMVNAARANVGPLRLMFGKV